MRRVIRSRFRSNEHEIRITSIGSSHGLSWFEDPPEMAYGLPMKITREEVRRVASLARLSFSPDEEEILTRQLDRVLGYVDKLNEIDTREVEPLAHVVEITRAFREDRVVNRPNPEALLKNAPAREKNFLKVPKILE
jgi:aspartyl-tRNA(Asn)/glutamyl-tRNA(Gln) amidotransferase subunit C